MSTNERIVFSFNGTSFHAAENEDIYSYANPSYIPHRLYTSPFPPPSLLSTHPHPYSPKSLSPTYAANPLPTFTGCTCAGATHAFQAAKFAFRALLRSNTTWPSSLCFWTPLVALPRVVGPVELTAQPRLGAVAAGAKVEPSERMHLLQRKV